MTNFEKVKHWMRIAGQECPDHPKFPDGAVVALRQRLMREEIVDELFPAMDGEDMLEVADGLADALYVVYGTAVAYGIDIDKIFDIVHENNMTKFDRCPNDRDQDGICSSRCKLCRGEAWVALVDEGGKVLKNPTWQPPDIRAALGLAPNHPPTVD